jgi:hypothetical protein
LTDLNVWGIDSYRRRNSMIPSTTWSTADILATVRRYWGYSELRPLQEQAIRAGLERRDSLVVMPTGGGKSLCYQVPAELAQRTNIVVSPAHLADNGSLRSGSACTAGSLPERIRGSHCRALSTGCALDKTMVDERPQLARCEKKRIVGEEV